MRYKNKKNLKKHTSNTELVEQAGHSPTNIVTGDEKFAAGTQFVSQDGRDIVVNNQGQDVDQRTGEIVERRGSGMAQGTGEYDMSMKRM